MIWICEYVLCLTLCNPMDCGPPGSTIHGMARILEWVAICFSRGFFSPQNWTTQESLKSPALAGRFFTNSTTWETPSEWEKKWKSLSCVSLRPHELYSPWNSPGQNIGVGSLSLLQGIFPTHGLNPGLLNCRWDLYQLSDQGGPTSNSCFKT